ncbi:hypothetical protein DM860_013110 [Cuscuta australis]|uniref:Retrotransposon Copia-like N-terminal domain-containing protein n=1 Tax=Cuscuta australis TaxID=267555 RepID=A0A328D7R1_9ASTE|nr:hypothetical protein DM860_013110 [Cuscuta australis]
MAESEVTSNSSPAKTPHLAFTTISNVKLHVPVLLSLSQPNYKKWSRLFLLLVRRFNLQGYINGSIVPLSEDDDEWLQLDALLQGWILSTISDEPAPLLCFWTGNALPWATRAARPYSPTGPVSTAAAGSLPAAAAGVLSTTAAAAAATMAAGFSTAAATVRAAPPDSATAMDAAAGEATVLEDQVIISTLLGSCIDTIQQLISMADTAAIAWSNLTSSFASASHGLVVSLKSKLSKNPRGTRSVQEYLTEMQSIANDLALAQHPVPEMDLIVHVLNQMGEEYDTIVSAARVHKSKLPFTELGDILKEHETKLKAAEESKQTKVATAHATQRSNPGSHARQQSYGGRHTSSRDA